MALTPETRYALSGGNHIAYRVADGTERDILYAPRTTTPIDLLWDDPIVVRGLGRLTACVEPRLEPFSSERIFGSPGLDGAGVRR